MRFGIIVFFVVESNGSELFINQGMSVQNILVYWSQIHEEEKSNCSVL